MSGFPFENVNGIGLRGGAIRIRMAGGEEPPCSNNANVTSSKTDRLFFSPSENLLQTAAVTSHSLFSLWVGLSGPQE